MLLRLRNLFKSGPRNSDKALEELSYMLWQEVEKPTYRRDFLKPQLLDFSPESLRHIDDYLECIHQQRPEDDDLLRVVLRVGAYVGEVIRRLSPGEYRWVAFAEAARHSRMIADFGMGLGTSAVLWKDRDRFHFPLAKVCKFVENGREDSVHFFVHVILSLDKGVPGVGFDDDERGRVGA